MMLRTVLKFSKCGPVSSPGIPASLSKYILFLPSRCQSSFLVSSLNAPVKLCQACFLSACLFFLLQDVALCRFVCSLSLKRRCRPNIQAISFSGILVIGVHRQPGLKLAQVLACRLQDGGGIRFSSFEATGVGIRASASGPEPLSSSPLNSIPCNLNECRTAC